MGNKYVWKADRNPPVGIYDVDRGIGLTSSKSRSTIIKEDGMKQKRPKDKSPDPGQYDQHLKPFGSEVRPSVSMGSKFEFKADSNPPVGGYDVMYDQTLSRSKGVYIEPEAERIHMFTDTSFNMKTATNKSGLGNYGASVNTSLVKSPEKTLTK